MFVGASMSIGLHIV